VEADLQDPQPAEVLANKDRRTCNGLVLIFATVAGKLVGAA
jgi:hypothetical protein